MFRNNLDGWNGERGWRQAQEGGDICIYVLQMIHIVVQQKPTQYYKAIILQLKILKIKKIMHQNP